MTFVPCPWEEPVFVVVDFVFVFYRLKTLQFPGTGMQIYFSLALNGLNVLPKLTGQFSNVTLYKKKPPPKKVENSPAPNLGQPIYQHRQTQSTSTIAKSIAVPSHRDTARDKVCEHRALAL